MSSMGRKVPKKIRVPIRIRHHRAKRLSECGRDDDGFGVKKSSRKGNEAEEEGTQWEKKREISFHFQLLRDSLCGFQFDANLSFSRDKKSEFSISLSYLRARSRFFSCSIFVSAFPNSGEENSPLY